MHRFAKPKNCEFLIIRAFFEFTACPRMNGCTLCQSSVESTLPELNAMEENDNYVHLETLHDESRNRKIPYATAGNTEGDPILFFPPLGGSRRMLLVLKGMLEKHSLLAICVSRPGGEGTMAGASASLQAELFCSDTIAVMDALKITKAGILCMCAGTPFAMAFCAKHPGRTTGKFLALGPWTLPADCPQSKRIDRFAAQYLVNLGVSSLVGMIQCTAMNSISKESMARLLQRKSSESEQQCLEKRYEGQSEGAFARDLDWVMGKSHNEKHDLAVCLSKSSDLGFTYGELKDQNVVIWQGSKDKIAYLPATKWLAEQLPQATLHVIPESTHQGALFLLGVEYMDSLAHLKVTL